MHPSIPTSNAFATMTWAEIAPHYDALEARSLPPDDRAAIERWLNDWNALDEALLEAIRLAEFQSAGDTQDPDIATRANRLAGEIAPQRSARQTHLAQKLLATGYTAPIWKRPFAVSAPMRRSSARRMSRLPPRWRECVVTIVSSPAG